MHLEQAQPVLRTGKGHRERRRARVKHQTSVRIELAHGFHIGGERRRQITAIPQTADAINILRRFLSLLAVQRITACSGMGIDVMPGLVLAIVIIEQFKQHSVLEHIGVVAGMKGVTITEHGQKAWAKGRMLPPQSAPCCTG
ncbi:hypothetical protein SDC9_203340 [bioreactor metagenome]|uniref:Uncharacterized protein n=1 Tax=bioreactor metagenome TaxID=1076179 RepID=A0A645IWU4_9ZZZZ